MKRLLSVFLVLCMLLMPFAAFAQGYLRITLNGDDVEAWLQAGLDEEGLPRLFGGYGGVDAGIISRGVLFNYNGLTMGASYKTILQTLLMQLFDLEKAPDFTGQDTAAVLLAVNRYINGLPADALSVEQTTLADGQIRTEVKIYPKKLWEYTDETVRLLLSDDDPQLTAFFQRQQEIICRLADWSYPAEDVRKQLLDCWEQLGLDELLNQEYPVSFAFTGGGADGAWHLKASVPGCELSVTAAQGRVNGHLMMDDTRYTFDSEDLLYIWEVVSEAALQAFRQNVYFSDATGYDRRTIQLEYSISGFVQSFFSALQRTAFSETDRLDGLMERLSPWLSLAGIDAEGLDAYQLFTQLGTLQQDILRAYEWETDNLFDTGRFSLSAGLRDVLPLRLEASLPCCTLRVNADGQTLDASLTCDGETLTLRGTFSGTTSVFVLTLSSNGSWDEQYILSVQHEDEKMSFRLTDRHNETLLTGTMDAQSLHFQSEELDGLITWNEDGLHAQLLYPDGNEIVTADLWPDGDTLRLEINVNDQRLMAEAGPDGFRLTANGLSLHCRLVNESCLQIGWQFGEGRYTNTGKLNMTEDSLSLSAASRYDRLELQLDGNGMMFTYTGRSTNTSMVVAKEKGSMEDQVGFRILIEKDTHLPVPFLYEGRLTATRLEQGLELKLTSEAHGPYTLNISWCDGAMVFEDEENCGWLKPETLHQFTKLFLQMQ